MLIPLEDLRNKHDMEVNGIVHVGAHEGQEHEEYRRLFGEGIPVVWIEADPVVYERLESIMASDNNAYCINAVISDTVSQVTFNRANNEQSSSFLPLGTHKQAHPEVVYVDSFEVETVSLDALAVTHGFEGLNFLNMDIQGAEGPAVAGAHKFLRGVDYIYSEVNKRELYVGCTTLEEFNEQLNVLGFDIADLEMLAGPGWGDAFYTRRES